MTDEEAIARARAHLKLAASVPARAWPVRRLDVQGADYVLVVFGSAQRSVAVATLSSDTGEVRAWANLDGSAGHLAVDEASAKVAAGLGDEATAELVWKPCRASLSPLYPLWLVRCGTEARLVNHAGAVFPESALGEEGGRPPRA